MMMGQFKRQEDQLAVMCVPLCNPLARCDTKVLEERRGEKNDDGESNGEMMFVIVNAFILKRTATRASHWQPK